MQGDYLSITFSDPSDDQGQLRIQFTKDPTNPPVPNGIIVGNKEVYDITDVNSYERRQHELAYYKELLRNGLRINKMFRPEDVSLEVIYNMFHDNSLFEDDAKDLPYRYSFSIEIMIDEKTSISYSYQGDRFTPEQMYELILSTECFSN